MTITSTNTYILMTHAVVSPDFSSVLQTFSPNCQLNISTWLLQKHLKYIMSLNQTHDPSTPYQPSSHNPNPIDDNTIYSVFQTRNLEFILDILLYVIPNIQSITNPCRFYPLYFLQIHSFLSISATTITIQAMTSTLKCQNSTITNLRYFVPKIAYPHATREIVLKLQI